MSMKTYRSCGARQRPAERFFRDGDRSDHQSPCLFVLLPVDINLFFISARPKTGQSVPITLPVFARRLPLSPIVPSFPATRLV
jgi:hypothetical protein